MALKRIGAKFEHYRVVEFDKYAIKSYNAVHGTDFPTIDITTVHAADLGIVDTSNYCYMMTYSFPCFTADTLVLTKQGYKKIIDVEQDEMVLTHTNTYEKVLDKKCTGKKQIWIVKGMGIDEIKCTQNHKFYVRELIRHYPTYENGKRGNVRTFNQPKWVSCSELAKKHYLGVAINQNSIIPKWNGVEFTWSDGRKPRTSNVLSNLISCKDFWWIVGRYLGDGWLRTQGGIIICCAKDELAEIIPYLEKCDFHYSVVEERTVFKIHIPLKEISEFLKPFGKGAKCKELPGYVFDMPNYLLEGLIEGFASADGYENGGQVKLATISKKLAYGMAQIIAKVYKTPYRIYKNHRKRKCVIEGRICNQNDGYEVVFKKEKKKQDKAFYENGYVWFPINQIECTNEYEEVYDIEVENSHSFTANGTIVHNCTDLSIAGLQKGMKKGSGTRSGLLWEVERLLKEMHELPQILFMENVTQVHNQQNIEDFKSWLNFLESLGYSNYWQDLNAKDFGVPQNRERCFMISLLGNYVYHFPQPMRGGRTKLKDLLEHNVAENFYLKSDKADKLIQQLIVANIPSNGETVETVLATKQGTQLEKQTDVGSTLCSRDYKGLKNRDKDNVVVEKISIRQATKKGFIDMDNGG